MDFVPRRIPGYTTAGGGPTGSHPWPDADPCRALRFGYLEIYINHRRVFRAGVGNTDHMDGRTKGSTALSARAGDRRIDMTGLRPAPTHGRGRDAMTPITREEPTPWISSPETWCPLTVVSGPIRHTYRTPRPQRGGRRLAGQPERRASGDNPIDTPTRGSFPATIRNAIVPGARCT